VPILYFLVGFFAVYFIVALIRRVLQGLAYCLGWLWGYADSLLRGRLAPSFAVLVSATALTVLVSR
jgi:hypothetical protein